MAPHPSTWLQPRPEGLFCLPGGFFIDPTRAVDRALITHGHADHARPGHAHVLASAETLAIMQVRMAEGKAGTIQQAAIPGERIRVNDVDIRFVPAGHVLGSCQIVLDYQGSRVVISGDYKRQPDPTCAPFEPMICDVFVTEATFGLPIFRHPNATDEMARLLASVALFPQRPHLIGAYGLGKTQRLIALLRQAGYDAPIFLHGALVKLCALYENFGVRLGDLRPATIADKSALHGAIVLAPPSAIADRWARRLDDPVIAAASGWMGVRQRAKASLVELPLVISDHADWAAILHTIAQTEAPEIWVTHGAEAALIHQLGLLGLRGRALALIGYGDDGEVA
ncbi:MAG TPA: ligase-associated DNA damage response exonuclease [Acidiphilium sp.]|nr:MAG: DNA ligase-associated DEXH box helicase [Acidiphilium sp. 21-60-14]OYV92095.1 MAG: DNA ligase-associated DEXH box helicase [Acidiphilium sp. 37-60-79]OZB40230.1 MAG: DNA ligase-associated DEXH box helicase [Acidiphilium sp. 34-60-192]HQT88437.1 ligase-associated DNA damage response exonuclease [Acidiphilium sp.]HQU23262.1 ligase-associated DNA damage response exonuclease [Acidiphilium sp.]